MRINTGGEPGTVGGDGWDFYTEGDYGFGVGRYGYGLGCDHDLESWGHGTGTDCGVGTGAGYGMLPADSKDVDYT